MKKFLVLLLCLFSITVFGQNKKVNEFTNTPTLASNVLFFVSTSTTNFNISWGQVTQLVATVVNAASATKLVDPSFVDIGELDSLSNGASISLVSGLMSDDNAIQVVDFFNRKLEDSGGWPVVDWWNHTLNYETFVPNQNHVSLDWLNKVMYGTWYVESMVVTNLQADILSITGAVLNISGNGSGLTNVPVTLGSAITGSNGAAAAWMLGMDAGGNVTSNAVPGGGGAVNALLTNTTSPQTVSGPVSFNNTNNSFFANSIRLYPSNSVLQFPVTITPAKMDTNNWNGSMRLWLAQAPFSNSIYNGYFDSTIGLATNTYGNPQGDITFSWGFNENGSVPFYNTNMPSWHEQRETCWQNYSYASQLEWWDSWAAPYTAAGTNASWRFQGGDLVWNTDNTYHDSDYGFYVGSFYVGGPFGDQAASGNYPFSLIGDTSKTMTLYGSEILNSNSNGNASITLNQNGILTFQNNSNNVHATFTYFDNSTIGTAWGRGGLQLAVGGAGTYNNGPLILQSGGIYFYQQNNSGTNVLIEMQAQSSGQKTDFMVIHPTYSSTPMFKIGPMGSVYTTAGITNASTSNSITSFGGFVGSGGASLTNLLAAVPMITNASAPAWISGMQSNTIYLWQSNNPSLSAVPQAFKTYFDAATNAVTAVSGL
ncbi:MAG: hypothetical protein KGL39_41395 [Patescibacteria group bacterium]|nr:hypothetical protein [Patescibacteria group bacterium]